jgi:hypothetical protein
MTEVIANETKGTKRKTEGHAFYPKKMQKPDSSVKLAEAFHAVRELRNEEFKKGKTDGVESVEETLFDETYPFGDTIKHYQIEFSGNEESYLKDVIFRDGLNILNMFPIIAEGYDLEDFYLWSLDGQRIQDYSWLYFKESGKFAGAIDKPNLGKTSEDKDYVLGENGVDLDECEIMKEPKSYFHFLKWIDSNFKDDFDENSEYYEDD